jgi:hypothetical protein
MPNIDFGRFIPWVVTGFRFAQSILLLQTRVTAIEVELVGLKIAQTRLDLELTNIKKLTERD